MRNLGTLLCTMLLLAASTPFTISADEEQPNGQKVEHTSQEKQAMAKVQEFGGTVMEIAQNDSRLDVAYHLTDGEVTDKHLVPLASMPQLYAVNLRGTAVTNDGLQHIANAKQLAKLHLERTKIGDAGLAHLKALEKLEYLNLYGTQVTDAGLKHLEGLKSLKRVYLWQTKVTDAGVKALQAKLPDVQIVRGLSLTPPKKPEPEGEKKKPAPKKKS